MRASGCAQPLRAVGAHGSRAAARARAPHLPGRGEGGGRVGSRVGGSVAGSVGGSVGGSIGGSVGGRVGGRVGGSVAGSVGGRGGGGWGAHLAGLPLEPLPLKLAGCPTRRLSLPFEPLKGSARYPRGSPPAAFLRTKPPRPRVGAVGGSPARRGSARTACRFVNICDL